MSTRVSSGTLLKSSRIRVQQAIFFAEFEYQLDLLREQPLLRPLSHMQELAARNYRSFPVNNYVCLYKFEHETIYIAHIFHQSQDYARLV